MQEESVTRLHNRISRAACIPAADTAARPPKLERPAGGVNFPRTLAAVGATVFWSLLTVTACSKPPRPAPVDAGAYWPMYMGNPARSPFLAQQVSTTEPNILWSAGIGPGFRSMPVVTDEVVVVAAADRSVRTVSRLDGTTFWRQKADGPPVSILVIGDVIYTATEDKGRVSSLALVDGDDTWDQELPSVIAPITIAGDTLFLATSEAALFAIEAGAETPIWRANLPRDASAGPLVLDDWIVYVAYDSIFLLNRSDATRQSSAYSPEFFIGEAASDGEVLYVATELGSLIAWSLPDLEFLWQASGFGHFDSGPVLADSMGYAVTRSGSVVRFNARDGSARIIAETGGTIIASPTVVKNGVLLGTLSGHLIFLSRNGERIWDVELEGSIEAPIFVHEGRLIVSLYTRRSGALASGSEGRVVELR